jgi:hydroxypyruvate reductase/glycerate 2-kinase
MTSADLAREIWWAGVRAVQPGQLIARNVRRDGDRLVIGGVALDAAALGRLVVVGAGKAGAAMAAALEAALGADLVQAKVTGWVNVPADAIAAAPPTSRIQLHPARNTAANVPTAEGVAGSQKILELVRGCGPADVCVCLISGGGSALLPAPVDGVTLEHKQAVTKLLAGCGAAIHEINTVRKHLSDVKGGRLAAAFAGRTLISLILSDVIGDPLDVIASGPTVADPTTYLHALGVLKNYDLTARVPAEVMAVINAGISGDRPETPKTLPDNIVNRVVGSARVALTAAAERAVAAGWSVENLGDQIEGETGVIAAGLADHIRSLGRGKRKCILSGGETTVTLGANPGKGGRNQEFALAAAAELGAEGLRGVTILCGGTDGEDGPTDAAGALADEAVWRRALAAGLDPADHLARHDAYHFFERCDGLFKSGPTGTNVMDLRVTLVE